MLKYFSKIATLILLSLYAFNINAQACVPEYTDGSSIYYITQYKINDIEEDNFSGYNDPEYYDRANYTTEVMDQTMFPLEITAGYGARVAVWIDYSGDNTFSSDEKIDEFDVESDEKVSKVINLNQGVTGNRRIRIRLVGDIGAANLDPCASYENGMTVDHILQIVAFEARAPKASFTTSTGETSTAVNNFVIFRDQSQFQPTSWSWEFEGGQPATSTSQNPIVKYTAEGCYQVKLTVSNALGNSTSTKTCYITVVPYCLSPDTGNTLWRANYFIHGVQMGQINNMAPNVDNEVNYSDFTDQSTDLDINTNYTITIHTISDISVTGWIDYDQDHIFEDNERILSYTAPNADNYENIVFTVPENAKPGANRLRLRSDWLESPDEITPCEEHYDGETEEYSVNINLIKPVADFEADTTYISTEDSIAYTDLSSNQPASWNWTFEGGTPASSTDQNPEYIKYPQEGTYKVSLTSSNAAGNHSEEKNNYIEVVYIESAMFSADYTEIIAGQTVSFTDESDNNPTSWKWYVDGTLFYESTDPANNSPKGIHFNTPGYYDITLTVEGDANTKLSRTKERYIKVNAPSGINEAEISPINVFPNPNNGQFALLIKGNEEYNNIAITDIQGKVVYYQALNENSATLSQSIKLEDITTGMYFIQVKSDDKVYVEKIQIQ